MLQVTVKKENKKTMAVGIGSGRLTIEYINISILHYLPAEAVLARPRTFSVDLDVLRHWLARIGARSVKVSTGCVDTVGTITLGVFYYLRKSGISECAKESSNLYESIDDVVKYLHGLRSTVCTLHSTYSMT